MSEPSLSESQARRIIALFEAGWEALVQVHPPREGFHTHAVRLSAEAVGRVTGEPRAFAELPPADRELLVLVMEEGERRGEPDRPLD